MSIIELLVRIGAMLAGVALLGCFLLSASRAALVNRHCGDWIAHGVGRFVCSTVSRLAAARRHCDAVQDALAWILPLYILSLIVTWFLLVQSGFSLILWSSHVEPGLLKAFLASGSALSTLGFLTPDGAAGQLLAILEGAMGLGVVVFFFTFIPGYQSAIQTRELRIAWLYARSGVNPSGLAVIEWLQRSGNSAAASDVWESWEDWFRLLAETVAIAPVLAIVPTLHRRQSWLTAAAVMLDAASFCLATLEGQALAAAIVSRTTGIEALNLIASKLRSNRAFGQSAASFRSTRAEFDASCARMAKLGAPIKADLNVAWEQYLALRREFESPLSELAAKLLVPMHESVPRQIPSAA
jgi:hypothetical protein